MIETGLLVGLSAALMAVFGSSHQLYKMIRTQDTTALSYPWAFWILCSVILWSGYGFYIQDPIVSYVNLIFVGLFISIISYKYKNERKC